MNCALIIFFSLTDFINNNAPEDILTEESLASIRSEIASSDEAAEQVIFCVLCSS